MTTILKFTSYLSMLILFSTSVYSQVPTTLSFDFDSYRNTTQVLQEGIKNVTFRFYTTLTGGVSLENQTIEINFTEGDAGVVLGSTSLTGNDTYFLSVEIEEQGESTPRTQLTSVTSALACNYWDGLDSIKQPYLVNNAGVLEFNETHRNETRYWRKNNTDPNIYYTGGNVGIGTTNATHTLFIRSDGGSQLRFGSSTSNAGGGFVTAVGSGQFTLMGGAEHEGGAIFGNNWRARSTVASGYFMQGGDSHFMGDAGLTVDSLFTPTLHMVIQDNGDVGIGVDPAQNTLHVGGEVRINDVQTGSNAGSDLCIDANNDICACGFCA